MLNTQTPFYNPKHSLKFSYKLQTFFLDILKCIGILDIYVSNIEYFQVKVKHFEIIPHILLNRYCMIRKMKKCSRFHLSVIFGTFLSIYVEIEISKVKAYIKNVKKK